MASYRIVQRPFIYDGAVPIVKVLDDFTAPLLKALDKFLPPRKAGSADD